LQKALFFAKEDLLKNSVNYFSYSENHNFLATAFGRPKPKKSLKLVMTNNAGNSIRSALIREVKLNCSEKFIISGEALSNVLPVGVENIHNTLKPYFDNFKIVCYVREPFGYARSAAQQHIKAGSISEKLISNTLNRDEPGWGNVLPNYKRRLEKYVRVFGKENVVVREFDRKKLKNQNIVDDFLFECLSFKGDITKFAIVNTNISLSGTLGHLLEVLNIEMPVKIEGKMNGDRSAELVSRLIGFSENYKSDDPYVLSNLDLNQFLEAISKDLHWLKSEFGVTFNLKKPKWEKPKTDIREIALLTNFLSSLVDETRGDMFNERAKKLKFEASLIEERRFRSFLKQVISIQRGDGEVEGFREVTNSITDVEFLQDNKRIFKNETQNVFHEIVEERINYLKNN